MDSVEREDIGNFVFSGPKFRISLARKRFDMKDVSSYSVLNYFLKFLAYVVCCSVMSDSL